VTVTLTDLRPIERSCYRVGAVLILSGAAHLVVAALDPRPWDGPLSWRKAVTFGFSFGTTLIAITWVASSLRIGERARTWLLGVFAADCVVEVTGITVQAWRHVPSHFNTETPFDTVVAMSLAVGGAVLIAVLGALAVTAFRGRIDGPPSLRLAVRAGFGLLLAGLGAGVAMIVRGETLIGAGHRAEAYTSAGFLKWFHAVTLHAVLVLPALAWLLARTRLDETARTKVVAAAAVSYVVVALAVLAVTV
jgi:hypothetical protein